MALFHLVTGEVTLGGKGPRLVEEGARPVPDLQEYVVRFERWQFKQNFANYFGGFLSLC